METQHVVFDLDGTLVDSLPGIQCAAQYAASQVFPDCTLPDLRPLIGPPIFEAIYALLGEGARAKSADFEACFRTYYDEVGWKQSVAYPEAADVIVELRQRNIRCYVVTNKPKLPTGRILDRLGLRSYLWGVVSRDSRTPGFDCKAQALRHIMEEFAIRAEAAVMVGDSADDAYAAKTCGLPFAAAAYGYGEYSRPVLEPCLPQPQFILSKPSGLCSALARFEALRERSPRLSELSKVLSAPRRFVRSPIPQEICRSKR